MLAGMFFWGGGVHVKTEFQNNATLCDTVHTDYRQEGKLNKRILLRNPAQKRGRRGAAWKMGEGEKDGVGHEDKDSRRGRKQAERGDREGRWRLRRQAVAVKTDGSWLRRLGKLPLLFRPRLQAEQTHTQTFTLTKLLPVIPPRQPSADTRPRVTQTHTLVVTMRLIGRDKSVGVFHCTSTPSTLRSHCWHCFWRHNSLFLEPSHGDAH